MYRLVLKILLLSVPMAIIFIIVFIVDPYNYFGRNNLIPNKIKERNVNNNVVLWKMCNYRINPCPNILLGDSRIEGMNEDEIYKISKMKVYNFAYNGCRWSEMIDTFWYAANVVSLQNVYIGISNEFYDDNRVSRVLKTLEYPIFYLSDKDVLAVMVSNLKQIFWKNEALGKRETTEEYIKRREQYWKKVLDIYIPIHNNKRNTDFMAKYYSELHKISEYCRSNNIKLTFINFPISTDIKNKVENYDATENGYITNISKYGIVYNFDYCNKYTTNDEFSDPYHYDKELGLRILKAIFDVPNPDIMHIYSQGKTIK